MKRIAGILESRAVLRNELIPDVFLVPSSYSIRRLLSKIVGSRAGGERTRVLDRILTALVGLLQMAPSKSSRSTEEHTRKSQSPVSADTGSLRWLGR